MSVQIIEGFEGGGPQARIWTIDGGSGGAGISTTSAGAWSRFCYSEGSSGGVAKPMKNQSATEIWIAARNKRTNNPQGIMGFYAASGNYHGRLNFTSGGVLQIEDSNGAIRGTGSTVLPLGVWNLIECHLKVGDAGTGQFEVRVHGLTTNEISDTTTGDYKFSTFTNVAYIVLYDAEFAPGWDDLIVYDQDNSSGAGWNTWVGDKVVVGLMPNAAGASQQWNPPVTTAQRWYFPDTWQGTFGTVPTDGVLQRSGGTGATPPITVAPDATWDKLADNAGNPYVRGYMSPYRQGTVNNRRTFQPMTWASGNDFLYGQFISLPLTAQTISGTVRMQMHVNSRDLATDLRSQLVVRVVSNDGTTVRSPLLYAGDSGSLTDEWTGPSNGTVYNTTFPRNTIAPVTMSSVSASAGDRLVVEFGFHAHAAGTNEDGQGFLLGDSGTSGDSVAADNRVSTETFNPWIEFSNAITVSDVGNWEQVNEASAAGPDDDGTYVETPTTNDIDFYAMENVPGAYVVSGPLAIKTQAKKVDPGARTITHVYNTNGSFPSGNQTGSAIGLPTGTYTIQETLLDLDATPTTGGAWSDSKVNGLQVGPKAT